MYKLLLVEDDPDIAAAVTACASAWALEVCAVQDFRNVMTEFAGFAPHIVLMDITLPYFNGYHWCSSIRQVSKVPILFLSSAADRMNIVMAVNMGGDDFVAKPFDTEVLMAKIQALLRRSYDFAPTTPVLEHRGALLDPGSGVLIYEEKEISLTRNEQRILQTLLQSKGNVVSREKLMEKLWATDCFVDENTLTVNVGRLRKKLDSAGLEDFITTRVGEGYLIK